MARAGRAPQLPLLLDAPTVPTLAESPRRRSRQPVTVCEIVQAALFA
jgi:hypothetical protein